MEYPPTPHTTIEAANTFRLLDLTSELVIGVIYNVAVADLRNLRLTNRLLETIASERLFERIKLLGNHENSLNQLIALTSSGQARFVKSLHIPLSSILDGEMPNEHTARVPDSFHETKDDEDPVKKYVRGRTDNWRIWMAALKEFLQDAPLRSIYLNLLYNDSEGMSLYADITTWITFYDMVLPIISNKKGIRQFKLGETAGHGCDEYTDALNIWFGNYEKTITFPSWDTLKSFKIKADESLSRTTMSPLFNKVVQRNRNLTELHLMGAEGLYIPSDITAESRITIFNFKGQNVPFADFYHFVSSSPLLKHLGINTKFIRSQKDYDMVNLEGSYERYKSCYTDMDIGQFTLSLLFERISELKQLVEFNMSLDHVWLAAYGRTDKETFTGLHDKDKAKLRSLLDVVYRQRAAKGMPRPEESGNRYEEKMSEEVGLCSMITYAEADSLLEEVTYFGHTAEYYLADR